MPELPEVETVRRGLERFVVGRKVRSAEVTGRRTVRRQDAAELVGALSGRRFAGTGRWGKYLWLELDVPRAPRRPHSLLVVHLRMSGQLLLVRPPLAPLAPHTHARLVLDDRSELRFVDPRTFGELFVTDERDDAGRPAVLAGLGPDPLVDGVDVTRLAELASRRRAALKSFLLDQRVLAGIGNLYADEICWCARLRPPRPVAGLRPAELRRLVEATTTVLADAVAARGSTLRDARYVDLLGESGAFQLSHAVYGRAGEPCPRCGHGVRRVRIAGRSAFFCPRCQR